MRFEWFVASRYLRSRRKQSFISIISIISIGGVALGVATVILVSAILDGVEQGLKDRFLANEAHVVFRLHDNSFFDDYQKRISQIETIDEVVATSPVVWAQSAVLRERSDTIQDVIYIKGIDPVRKTKSPVSQNLWTAQLSYKTHSILKTLASSEMKPSQVGLYSEDVWQPASVSLKVTCCDLS